MGETLPCETEAGNTHNLYAVPADTDPLFPADFRYFNSAIRSYVRGYPTIFVKIFWKTLDIDKNNVLQKFSAIQ